MENKYMTEWKRNSIRIGAPTCILAAFTAFIPVLYLCSRYNCWPSLEVVLSAWALTALSFGAFYIVEPIAVHHQPQCHCTGHAHRQIEQVEAGGGTFKGKGKAVRKVQ